MSRKSSKSEKTCHVSLTLLNLLDENRKIPIIIMLRVELVPNHFRIPTRTNNTQKSRNFPVEVFLYYLCGQLVGWMFGEWDFYSKSPLLFLFLPNTESDGETFSFRKSPTDIALVEPKLNSIKNSSGIKGWKGFCFWG